MICYEVADVRRNSSSCGMPGAILMLLLASAAVRGSEPSSQTITPNFKDADLTQVAEAVSVATGKNFIIDPRVRGEVTMLSTTPMSPAAFYEAFLAILQVHGFIAVPAGDIIKVLPDANARQIPSVDLPGQVSATSDEIVTQVIDVKNVSAVQLVPILRPMIPQYGHLAAYPASNILIISDRASNVNRMIRIIRRVDQVGDQSVEIVPLQNASSTDTVRVLNSLFQQAAAAEGGVAVKVVADERSNSVLISGDQSQRLRIRALVAHLDTPLKAGGDTQVRYLHYADAEKVAPKLKEYITGIAQGTPGGTGGPQGSPQAQAEKNAIVLSDPATNSLIIMAPPKIMRALTEVVDKLDIRRAQVLVEAVIVEVNADKTSDLGVNWAAWSNGSNGTQIPAGAFIEPIGGSSLADVASTVQGIANGSATSTSSLTGTTLALGKISANGINFGAMLRAMSGDANTNVVATPSAITMDNQEAELKVAQEVPFITGQYATTSGSTTSTSSTVSPFTTVQRQEVGTILKVTPQIATGSDSVILKISIESSSVAATSVSTVDITTNKRTVSTSVLIEDGGIVVLGGLISDNVTKSEQRVPFLGSLPLIGFFFKTRDYSRTRNNLMIFIRPKILHTAEQTAIETGAKYNYMLDEQHKADKRDSTPLLPGEKQPTLPPLTEIPGPATSGAEKSQAAQPPQESK
ncbi:MAG: ral secretion pathway protein [Gammaproteobacteria bacterium]|nr:ral secretion pathway protein [Gammaproteobacteria bacterium]